MHRHRTWLARPGRPDGTIAKHISTARGLAGEAIALTLLLTLYRWGRSLADGRHALARGHAEHIYALERLLHLPDELAVQHWLLAHDELAHIANAYYASVHFPLTGAALVWLYLRRRNLYRRVRDTLILMTGAGLVIAFWYPLAPPRMMTGLGFADVAVLLGQSVYDGAAATTSNQFAAMPSLHVGWSVLVGWALFRGCRSQGRWLWWLHPLLTVLVVVGTGNHFWADGIVGVALFVLGRFVAGLVDHRHDRSATPAADPPLGVTPRPRTAAESERPAPTILAAADGAIIRKDDVRGVRDVPVDER